MSDHPISLDPPRSVENHSPNLWADLPGAQWKFSKKAWVAQLTLSGLSTLFLLIIVVEFAATAIGVSSLVGFGQTLIGNKHPPSPTA